MKSGGLDSGIKSFSLHGNGLWQMYVPKDVHDSPTIHSNSCCHSTTHNSVAKAWRHASRTGQYGHCWVAANLVKSSLPAESLPVEAKIPPAPTPRPSPAATAAPKPGSPTATIIGRVMGKDGDPKVSEPVSVTVLGSNKRIEAWTGADGRFVLSGIPAGEHNLLGLLIGLDSVTGHSLLVAVNGDFLFTLQPGATVDVGEIKVSW